MRREEEDVFFTKLINCTNFVLLLSINQKQWKVFFCYRIIFSRSISRKIVMFNKCDHVKHYCTFSSAGVRNWYFYDNIYIICVTSFTMRTGLSWLSSEPSQVLCFAVKYMKCNNAFTICIFWNWFFFTHICWEDK